MPNVGGVDRLAITFVGWGELVTSAFGTMILAGYLPVPK